MHHPTARSLSFLDPVSPSSPSCTPHIYYAQTQPHQDSMSAASFLMLMVAADMLFTTILSSLVLRRSVSRSHWISVAFVIIAFVMYEFVQYRGGDDQNWHIDSKSFIDNLVGLLFCLLSRFSQVLLCVLSRKEFLKRSYRGLDWGSSSSSKGVIRTKVRSRRLMRVPGQHIDVETALSALWS